MSYYSIFVRTSYSRNLFTGNVCYEMMHTSVKFDITIVSTRKTLVAFCNEFEIVLKILLWIDYCTFITLSNY